MFYYDTINLTVDNHKNEEGDKASSGERMEDSIDDIESGKFVLADQLKLWNKSGSLQEDGGDYSWDDVLKN